MGRARVTPGRAVLHPWVLELLLPAVPLPGAASPPARSSSRGGCCSSQRRAAASRAVVGWLQILLLIPHPDKRSAQTGS